MSGTPNLVYKIASTNDFYAVGTNQSTGPNAISADFSGKVVIPKTYSNLPIREIGNHAFFGCSKITEVEILADIIIFHEYAFDRCSSLKRINIPSSTEYLNIYAITFTTNQLGQSSGTAEIIFEPKSKIKRIVSETFVKRENINIYLCDIINPSICENNWFIYSTVNVYSPYPDMSFCNIITKKGIHTQCPNLSRLLHLYKCTRDQIILNLRSLIYISILYS